jgi:hypothetical protein
MRSRLLWSATGIALGCGVWLAGAPLAAQALGRTASEARAGYTAPRTPWGDPDLQGSYTNSNESLIPMERPPDLAGKTLDQVTPEELERLIEARSEAREEADRQRWELRSPAARCHAASPSVESSRPMVAESRPPRPPELPLD